MLCQVSALNEYSRSSSSDADFIEFAAAMAMMARLSLQEPRPVATFYFLRSSFTVSFEGLIRSENWWWSAAAKKQTSLWWLDLIKIVCFETFFQTIESWNWSWLRLLKYDLSFGKVSQRLNWSNCRWRTHLQMFVRVKMEKGRQLNKWASKLTRLNSRNWEANPIAAPPSGEKTD